MKIVLNLQFLTCKKYSKHRSTVKNCNFSKLQFFKCTSTVIPLHIFAVYVICLFLSCTQLSSADTPSLYQHSGAETKKYVRSYFGANKDLLGSFRILPNFS